MWTLAIGIVFLASLIVPMEAHSDSESLPPGIEVSVSVNQPEAFTRFSNQGFEPPTIQMSLRVFNSSDRPVTLPFASGQEFDFMIFNDDSQLIWKWSEGKFFIMILTELILAPSKSKTFNTSHVFIDKDGGSMPEGLYTVTGRLAVPSKKIEDRTQFSHGHLF